MSITSDWGEWLPQAMRNTTPDELALWHLGCTGIALKASDGTTLFVDPYLGTGDPPRTVRMIPVPFAPEDVHRADAVLATHEHTDHVHGPSQAPLLEDGGTFYGPDSALAVARDEEVWTEYWDVSPDQFSVVTVGDTLEVGPYTVHVESAADPHADNAVSYVIEHGDTTLFHGGDSHVADEFEAIGARYDVDVALLAFGSVGRIYRPDEGFQRNHWYMGHDAVVEAANLLQAECLIPTHYDMWKGFEASPTALVDTARSLPFPHDIEAMSIGDRLNIGEGRRRVHFTTGFEEGDND